MKKNKNVYTFLDRKTAQRKLYLARYKRFRKIKPQDNPTPLLQRHLHLLRDMLFPSFLYPLATCGKCIGMLIKLIREQKK